MQKYNLILRKIAIAATLSVTLVGTSMASSYQAHGGMSGKADASVSQAIASAHLSKMKLVNGSDPSAYVIVINPSRSAVQITGSDYDGGTTYNLLQPAQDSNQTTAWTIDDSNPVAYITVSLSDENGTIYNNTQVPSGTCLFIDKDGRGVTQTHCF